MRLIPVIDLFDDKAVHAVKGRRAHYQPVKSILCATPDPLELATAFRDQLNLYEIYIADLDSIQGFSRTRHQSLIQDLCGIDGMHIILDAGISDVENAQAMLDLGVQKVIIGSETLSSLNDLHNITARIEPHRLVFSLDFKRGEILSRCRSLAEMSPIDALKELRISGWNEVILLDLNRVGSREGADVILISRVRDRFPDFRLLIGGGIAKPEDLLELKSMGIDGVLLATALHNGAINSQHLAFLGGKNSGTFP